MPRKIVAGNWKMNGTQAALSELAYIAAAAGDVSCTTILCPPTTLLQAAAQSSGSLAIGGQNCHHEATGAHTGDVSAQMLADVGAQYVIVGHSERSTAYCESDENIADKFNQIKKYNMTPLLCIGENLIEREAGIMEKVVSEQIKTILDLYGQDIFKGSIIAYEPIWAIGSDSAASPDQIQQMCEFIKQLINTNIEDNNDVNIVYGGSVNAKNAVQLCEINGVDGILMGRASLDLNEFYEICNGIHKI